MISVSKVTAVPISMRHPAWRWNAALLVVADKGNVSQSVSLCKDLDIREAVKFCNDKQRPIPVNHNMYVEKHRDVYEAYLINMSNNPNGGYKWQIEAMLMTGVDHATIASNYMFDHGAKTIATYEKLFFDISPYREKPLCVLGNVLSSSLSASTGIDDYDYSWKAFAYSKGYEDLLKFLSFRTGSRLTKNMRKWFDEMTQDRVAYGAFSTSAQMRNMFNQQAIQVLDIASRYYSISQTVANKLKNPQDGVTLAAKEVLAALQDVILDPNIEHRVANNTSREEPLLFNIASIRN